MTFYRIQPLFDAPVAPQYAKFNSLIFNEINGRAPESANQSVSQSDKTLHFWRIRFIPDRRLPDEIVARSRLGWQLHPTWYGA
jgi:hypothetical protein